MAMLSPRGHTADSRELLYDFTAGHEGADDVGAWAVNQQRMESLRMGEQYRREQEEAAQRLRVLQESADHYTGCNGNCNQGRACPARAARDGVSVYEPQDEPRGWAQWWSDLRDDIKARFVGGRK